MWSMFPQHYAMTCLGFCTGPRPSSLRPLRRRGDQPDVVWSERRPGQVVANKRRDGARVIEAMNSLQHHFAAGGHQRPTLAQRGAAPGAQRDSDDLRALLSSVRSSALRCNDRESRLSRAASFFSQIRAVEGGVFSSEKGPELDRRAVHFGCAMCRRVRFRKIRSAAVLHGSGFP